MAYLPTVNETGSGGISRMSLENITKSLRARVGFSSISSSAVLTNTVPKTSLVNFANAQIESTKNSSVLNRLYEFMVNDSIRKENERREDSELTDKEQAQNEKNELILLAATQQQTKPQEEESLLSKLIGVFKTISTGMSIYRNWGMIEKLLGLQGLGDSIRKIGEEFGLDKVIDNIKNTIDDIMDNFRGFTPLSATSELGTDGKPVKVTAKGFNTPEFNAYLNKLEEERGLSKGTLGAVMMQESSGINKGYHYAEGATTPEKSDFGLFGIKKDYTGKQPGYGIKPLQDVSPEEQARFAADYIQKMAKRTGSEAGGIAAFHTGLGGYQSTGKGGGQEYVGLVQEKRKFLATNMSVRASRIEHGETGEVGGTVPVSLSDKAKEAISREMATDKDLVGLNFRVHAHGQDRLILKKQADKVQQLRKALGLATFFITCGYRPPWYNDALSQSHKGVAKDSYHKYHKACDIAIPKGYSYDDVAKFVDAASKVGFGGIGVYLGDGFIHVDIGPTRSWTLNVPEPIKSALIRHISGRKSQVENDTTVPAKEVGEPNETGLDQSKPSVREQEVKQQKQKDFLQEMEENYVKQLGILKGVFVDSFSPDNMAKLEDKLVEFSKQIPNKDSNLPNLPQLFNQSNIVINSVQQNRYTNQSSPDPQQDLPSILTNKFLQ